MHGPFAGATRRAPLAEHNPAGTPGEQKEPAAEPGEGTEESAENEPIAAAAEGEPPSDSAEDDVDEEPEPDYEILPVDEAAVDADYDEEAYDDEDADADYDEVEDAGQDDEDDEEARPAGFDRRPDVFNWVLTPVTTLVVGPALAASIGLFVAEGATDYPRVCAPVRLANGCEETLLRLLTEHVIAFGFFWLLLWAMPWWRGLRAYRIGLAVVAALILIAIPLRLIRTIQVGDRY